MVVKLSKNITKPSIIKVARKAGVKNISEDCMDPIRQLIVSDITEIMRHCVLINNIKGTKTILLDDLHEALKIMGYNTAKSDELNSLTMVKPK
jgi:histone H3/H4